MDTNVAVPLRKQHTEFTLLNSSTKPAEALWKSLHPRNEDQTGRDLITAPLLVPAQRGGLGRLG